MPVTYKPLTREDRQSVHDLAASVYLDGECYAFAIAMHRELGWPLIGLMNGTVIRHACVRFERKFFDVRGVVTLQNLGKPFEMKPPYELREITEADLFAVRPIHEQTIAGALWRAQAIWPHLSWKRGPKAKFTPFLAELEELCAKHGVYIFAPFPTAMPVLTERVGDEKGYCLTPSMNGRNYLFDRVL